MNKEKVIALIENDYGIPIYYMDIDDKYIASYMRDKKCIYVHTSYKDAEDIYISQILFHELAHALLHIKGPHIIGIHAEYLCEYFSYLCLGHSGIFAHRQAIYYKDHVSTLGIYDRIKYSYKTLKKAKGRLANETVKLKSKLR